MIARLLITVAFLVGLCVFLAAFVWPSAALLIQCSGELHTADLSAALGQRQAMLLARTILLVVISTIVSMGLGLVAAPALAGRHRQIATIISFMVLFCPPMVYAFGWLRVLPAALGPHVGCTLVWSLWAWPISAMIIAGGMRADRDSYEAALLSTGRASAYARVILPTLVPNIALSGLAIVVLLLGEYTTPHAFGLVVYSTELLGWAVSSPSVIDSVVAAAPLVLLMVILLAILFAAMRRDHALETNDFTTPRSSVASFAALVILAAIAAGVPIGALIAKLSGPAAISSALQTYAWDTGSSLAVAAVAGFASVALAVAVGLMPRLRRAAIAGAVLIGVIPGALVGEAMIAGFNRPSLAFVYDHWPIVALAYIARYAWFGACAGLLLARDARGCLADQAATDGAPWPEMMAHIVMRRNVWLLTGVGFVVAALSLAEVAATSMVRVPSFSPISQVIIEKFHRFEDDMLISLSLILLLASAPAAWIIARVRPYKV